MDHDRDRRVQVPGCLRQLYFDPVTVSAIDKNKDKEFYRYVLLLKFTYMTCGNCVTAQGYFDALDEADRDHFLVVAAHQPEGMPMDPYWCSED